MNWYRFIFKKTISSAISVQAENIREARREAKEARKGWELVDEYRLEDSGDDIQQN